MKMTMGKEGLEFSWQAKFPETTKCVHCSGESRIGFVVHEGMEEKLKPEEYVCSLHHNDPKGGRGYWLHDCCAVAIYFCRKCLLTTSLYNQA